MRGAGEGEKGGPLPGGGSCWVQWREKSIRRVGTESGPQGDGPTRVTAAFIYSFKYSFKKSYWAGPQCQPLRCTFELCWPNAALSAVLSVAALQVLCEPQEGPLAQTWGTKGPQRRGDILAET